LAVGFYADQVNRIGRVTAHVIAPDGSEATSISAELGLYNWISTMQMVLDLTTGQVGRHEFCIDLDGQEVARVPLTIRVRNPHEPESQP